MLAFASLLTFILDEPLHGDTAIYPILIEDVVNMIATRKD
jgi:hypothetical protein